MANQRASVSTTRRPSDGHLEIWNTLDLDSEVRGHHNWTSRQFQLSRFCCYFQRLMQKGDLKTDSLAKEAFTKMKPILCERKLSMPITICLLQTFICPMILCGSQSWPLNAEARKNIEATEMWFYRHMLTVFILSKVFNYSFYCQS